MHRIMQILHNDHINVTALLDLMENVLEQVRTGDPARLDVAYNTMRYMTAYPDLYHHPTEDVLFHHLVKRAAETEPIVTRLFEEHVAIGEAGAAFRDELKTAIGQASEAPMDLVGHGVDYIAQLRSHMNTEEGQIFPLTKVILSHRDWELLDETIATTGDPLFGAQVKKGYQELARALSKG